MNGIFSPHLLLFPCVILSQSSDKQPITENSIHAPICYIPIRLIMKDDERFINLKWSG